MWYPDVTVAAICELDGKFLLVEERAKSSGKIVFNQPAGHIEEGETIIEAVIRETREETCRHFTPSALVGFYRMQITHGKTYLRYAFCGTVSEVDSSLSLDSDIIQTHWMTPEDIYASTQLRSGVVSACLNDYLAGIRYPLEILREI